jgi:PHD/YefM family antitoxin component YafN of YafNO toxin-antitoxin module
MPQIRPITDLRNTTEISELCHNSGEPIFITKNGYGDMVVMSNETYERELAAAEIFRKLLVAQRQIDSGEGLDGEDVLKKMRERIKQPTPSQRQQSKSPIKSDP